MSKTGEKFEELVEIMRRLRAPDGCPWDREQTYKSIAPHTLEETHEVLQTIDEGNIDGLCEELGDLLLQILFYSQIATEEKRFSIDEVIDGICKKLIHRHPHVFGDEKVTGASQVLEQWEVLKKKEGKKTVLGGVPASLPSLLKAYRMGEKTSRMGFDWSDAEGILDKVEEEARELHEARESGNPDAIDHEYGDLLFTLANLGRFLEIDPEGALRRASNRFMGRFGHMEESANKTKRELRSLSPDEWNKLWETAKKEEVE